MKCRGLLVLKCYKCILVPLGVPRDRALTRLQRTRTEDCRVRTLWSLRTIVIFGGKKILPVNGFLVVVSYQDSSFSRLCLIVIPS